MNFLKKVIDAVIDAIIYLILGALFVLAFAALILAVAIIGGFGP